MILFFKSAYNLKRFSLFVCTVSVFAILFGSPAPGFGLGWTDQTIRLLPDSSFAMVEVSENGKRYRRCPHYDSDGNLDMEQLIYVLGTFEKEKWLDKKNKKRAKQLLKKYYDKFKTKTLKKQFQSPLNINRAKLTELVTLPNIGPVLAVKIAEYRDTRSHFLTIEDIKNVEGIGIRTFNAIRHYIRVD